MTFTTRRPALSLPPATRASRWTDVAAANHWTTATLRRHEGRLRDAASRGEAALELRGPAPASAGELFVRAGGDVQRHDVSCAVVRMDLSGPSPVARASLPEALPLLDDAWDLLQVLSRFREDAAEDWFDPRQALDDALAADPRRAERAAVQWRGLTASATTGEAARIALATVSGTDGRPVEGTSWSGWADWFTTYLDEVAEGRLDTSADASRPGLVRTGEFDEGVDLEDVVQQVLGRRGDEVDRWRGEATGLDRLHVWADLGRAVGTVSTRGPDLSVTATAVAVVLQRNDTAEPEVLDAHPEVPLDDGLRARLPAAAAVLGGWFGPSLPHTDVLPWPAQRRLLSGGSDEVLAGWRRDARALLALPDAEQGRALLRLGGAVVPSRPRGWLERMLWRMDAFPGGGQA